MYKIKNKPDTALPLALVERYRTADGPALKAALWFLLNGSCTPEKLSKEISLPLEVSKRVINYWLDAGLIVEDTDSTADNKEFCETDVTTKDIKVAPRKITTLDLTDILLRDSELATLLQSAQDYLSRPLTTSESSKLASIYLETELPAEVLLMIIAYCQSRAKRGVISYIAKVAGQWKDDGITTADKAERHLQLLETREAQEKRVADILECDGSFTYRERQYISIWYEQYKYGDDFVREAYLHAGKPSVSYINGILKSWYSDGITSVSQTRLKPSNAQAPVKPKQAKSSGGSLIKKAAKKNNS